MYIICLQRYNFFLNWQIFFHSGFENDGDITDADDDIGLK